MTPSLILSRFCYAPDGTFGRMAVGGQWLFTVERPWLGNQPYISCIPEGLYWCEPRRYNAGGYPAIEILRVPARTHILFHKANRPQDLGGCIAPGCDLGCLHGQWAVLRSSAAFELLMEEFGNKLFLLEIRSGMEVPYINTTERSPHDEPTTGRTADQDHPDPDFDLGLAPADLSGPAT